MKNKGDLTNRLASKETSYQEDIALEVSQELGLPMELCLEIQKNLFKFVVEEAQSEEVYSINLPFLGVLYLNKILCNSKRRKLYYKCKGKNLPEVEEQLSFWKKKIEVMEAYKKNNNLVLAACKHATLPFQSKFASMLPDEYVARKYSGQLKGADIYAAVEELQNIGYYKDLELIKGKKY
jgi:hypothetical protein